MVLTLAFLSLRLCSFVVVLLFCCAGAESEQYLDIIRRQLVYALKANAGDDSATYRTLRKAVSERMGHQFSSKEWRRWFRAEIDKAIDSEPPGTS